MTKTVASTPRNGDSYALQEVIAYEITVTNAGNVTCKNVKVVDELTNAEWTIEALAVGESRSFETSYEVTEADILAGHVLNEVTAQGDEIPDPKHPEEPPKVPKDEDEADEPTNAPNPSLFVNKRVIDPPLNGRAYALGETIRYAITVLNNGNVTVSDITVTDDLTGASWTIGELGVMETSDELYTEHVVTEEDILNGKVLNVATATGKDPEGNEPNVIPGKAEVDTDDPNPDFSLVKELTKLPEKGYFTLGETAEFTITVTNVGNLTLTNIVVTEELEGAAIVPDSRYSVSGSAATIATLAPNEEVVIAATYTVTEADLGEEIFNRVSAKGEGPKDPDPKDDEEKIPTDDVCEVNGAKIWSDADDAYGTRPETITLRLMANGAEIANTEVRAESGWTYSFTKLPVHDAEGAEIAYAVAEDAVAGYETSYAEEGYDVTNALKRHTLTIRYWYNAIGGEAAAPTVTNTYNYGESYNVASPNLTGYSVSEARISGVMEGDVEYDVIYTPNSYRLTVRYVYQNGDTAAPTYRSTLTYGEAYRVGSPTLNGYTVSRRTISGTMPGRDLVYTVIYVPGDVEVIIDEYGVPLGIGNVEMNVGDCFE